MDADDEFEEDVTPWTQDGAAELVAASEAFAEAVREHARALAALTDNVVARGHWSPKQDLPVAFAATNVLTSAVLAYGDAQGNLIGNSWPFGALRDLMEDDDEDDGDWAGEAEVGSGVSVLSRHDYLLTDEEAALAAGRAAYQELWPEDPPSAAASDVTHIGRALYQYAHLHGWDKLKEMPGLAPTGAATLIHAQEDLLSGAPEGWPDEPFDIDAPVIHNQSDVYS